MSIAVRPRYVSLEQASATELSDQNANAVGYQENHLTVARFQRVKSELKRRKLVPIGSAIDDRRSIKDPDEIRLTRKAVRIARGEKPGAVHIELPEDIAKHDTDARPMTPRRYRRPAPDDKIVDRAFELLSESRRPVIIAGNGTIRRRASKQLRQFCERTEWLPRLYVVQTSRFKSATGFCSNGFRLSPSRFCTGSSWHRSISVG